MDHSKASNTTSPTLFYGTAWKEDKTQDLTAMALQVGFRAIDTANQRKHYYEAGVGEAVADFLASGAVSRSDLFLQTKFTYLRGQDHRLPYDASASPQNQVLQSFESSLTHLQTSYIDSYLLHGPMQRQGLTNTDIEVWRTMERLYHNGHVRMIGVSNFHVEQLRDLLRICDVKPTFVQNRCYSSMGWDRQMRNLCMQNQIHYQAFSLLTANRQVWHGPRVAQLAHKYHVTPAQVLFAFALQVGMLPITGTTNERHMRDDIASSELAITADEYRFLTTL